jgi:hypothetical protein
MCQACLAIPYDVSSHLSFLLMYFDLELEGYDVGIMTETRAAVIYRTSLIVRGRLTALSRIQRQSHLQRK